ncbi:Guanine nucleotide-binding protein-like 1 [Thelohanellus kitauei]|uniref:Guanine nucleotide-binding protein-like 1 n=1 Tax=Thelohanellus kitauei TaxID=669202 RepID=A0A0C2J8D5_THEKT|nr:Guanine nucleotide-binding protein-like 1 [Thelohanellus kitauei]
MILVLNKVDISRPEHAVAWKYYFTSRFPNIQVVLFTNFPKDPETVKENASKGKVMSRVHRKKGGFMCYGAKEFLEACQICFPQKNFENWKWKVESETLDKFDDSRHDVKDFDSLYKEWESEKTQNKFLTIGIVGYPNVGKSSFLNGLKGRKVASVSKTPGHTKYFQTIFITNDVVLCDCPGLVFPSTMDKQFQIVSGLFPISQVREPYTSVGFIAERINLVDLLKLKHLSGESQTWSAWTICEAWAKLRGFRVAKSGRLDAYRAANHLLRLATTGKINIYSTPPGYSLSEYQYIEEPETINLYAKLKKYSNTVASSAQGFRTNAHLDVPEEELDERTSTADADARISLSNRFSVLRVD